MKRLPALFLAALVAACTDAPTTTGLKSVQARADLLEFAGSTVHIDAYFRGALLPADPPFWPKEGGLILKKAAVACEVSVFSEFISTMQPCGNPIALPPGDYFYSVTLAGALVVEEPVTLVEGQVFRRDVDVDAVAMRVRGRFLVNGEPDGNREYCVTGPLKGLIGCFETSADGTFDLMTHAGPQIIERSGDAPLSVGIKTAPAGQILDLGDVFHDAARVVVRAMYHGQPLPPEQLDNCHVVLFSGKISRLLPCGEVTDFAQGTFGKVHLEFWERSIEENQQDVSIEPGETLELEYDLTSLGGFLTTSMTLGGAPLAGAEACIVATVELTRPLSCRTTDAEGRVTFFGPNGDLELATETENLAVQIVAGLTTEHPPVNLDAAFVTIDAVFNGERMQDPVECRSPFGIKKITIGTTCPLSELVAPGTHTLTPVVLGKSLPSFELTFAGGETRELLLETSTVAGVLFGRATLSGRPVPPEAFICATSDGGKDTKTGATMCASPDEIGRFRLLVPAGTAFLHVAGLRSAESYTVAAGQTLEVGEPELPDFTPPGTDVEVSPIDQTTQEPSPIDVTFDNVSSAGATTVTSTGTGAPLPGFKLGSPPVYYDIQTTATFSGSIKVCIDYSGQSFGNENALKLMHHNGTTWENVTLPGYPDIANDIICGEVTSLSPFTVAEQNFAPSVTGIQLPDAPVALGTATSIAAAFTDANPTDVHTATINWDGVTTSGGVSQAAGGGMVSGQHTFSAAGVYTVSVTVSDGELSGTRSSSADAPAYIVVYDPTSGFVTGGGWIVSPPGAYTGDPALTGKATFGFVSRYARGATTPSGNTEFHFSAGDLRFRSSSYEWLVTAGARAQFKGTGEINGVSGYGFLITAIDGQVNGGGGVDKFRIKIWSSSGTVYDNQISATEDSDAATELGGGSIRIHQQ